MDAQSVPRLYIRVNVQFNSYLDLYMGDYDTCIIVNTTVAHSSIIAPAVNQSIYTALLPFVVQTNQ